MCGGHAAAVETHLRVGEEGGGGSGGVGGGGGEGVGGGGGGGGGGEIKECLKQLYRGQSIQSR